MAELRPDVEEEVEEAEEAEEEFVVEDGLLVLTEAIDSLSQSPSPASLR